MDYVSMKAFLGALFVCLLAIVAGCDEQPDSVKEPKAAKIPMEPPDSHRLWTGFSVRDVTGPAKGTNLCYYCLYGARPVVAIFTRELNDNVRDLVKQIDVRVGEKQDEKLAAFVVVLTEDETEDEEEDFMPRIRALAKDAGITNTPITILQEPSPPPAYEIADDAEVTVMMWVEKQVKFRRSFASDELDKIAIDNLVAETNKIIE
jgi:nucleotide-binding universal stress UspA family protein